MMLGVSVLDIVGADKTTAEAAARWPRLSRQTQNDSPELPPPLPLPLLVVWPLVSLRASGQGQSRPRS